MRTPPAVGPGPFRVRVGVGALALLAIAGAACPAEPPPARHLLLVTLDTVRADRLGCYGRASAGTPNLDALAREGTRFERVYAQAPLTLPSHVSMFTGLYPPRTGVHVNEQTELDPSVRTLAERLRGRGFFTAAAVGGYPVSRRFPTSRGFERFDDRFEDPHNPSGVERDAGLVVRAALDLLRERGGRRAFLWVHFYDPHDPYAPAAPFAERFPRDPYQGEIARVDAALGELLRSVREELGPEGLLVSVVADHGEALDEHGEPTHGFFVYEPTVRVPWILSGPRVPAGAVVPGPVATVDLVPTLLDLLGLPAPEERLDGVRVDPAAADPPHGEPIYLETELPLRNYGWSPLRAAVDGTRKYVAAPRPELYDLARDPGELRNLAGARNTAELAQWIDEVCADAVAGGAGGVDPALLSLGYVGATGSTPSGDLADPKDRLDVYVRFQTANRLLETGNPEKALPLLDELLAAGGGSGVRFKRAVALRMAGRFDEATAELDRVASEVPDHAGVLLERGRIALWAGNAGRAFATLDRYVRRFPEHAEALMLRGAAREMRGDAAGAERDYLAALEANPANREASLRIAALLVRTGRVEQAEVRLRAHLERFPDDPLARGLLGAL